MKFLLSMICAGGAALGFYYYGDEMEIPEHFLAAEEKACLRQATRMTTAEIAAAYCGCVSASLGENFRFKTYILRNAAMGWQARREGVSASEIAARDPQLRGMHLSCRQEISASLRP